ncbi:MAG: DMT family transporter [Sphingomonadaceae bacterium]|jgi:drug/metabolite transporter (DMT)-like permease
MALIATMMALVKHAGDLKISMPEVMFWRQAVTLPILFFWLWYAGSLSRLKTKRMSSHAFRAAIGTAGMLCHFTAAMLLPLAEATTFGFTAPLYVVLISAFILREHVGPWRWTAVVLGFLGVLVITQPGGHPIPPLGLAAGLMSGVLVAIVNFLIRDIAQTDTPEAAVFYFGVFGALIAGVFLPFYAVAHSGEEWLVLLGIGVVGTISQLLITVSLRYAPVVTVIVIDYTTLVWTMAYGWAFWDQFPPFATWLGAPLIIAAGLIIAWRQHRLSKDIAEPVLTGGGQSGT